MSDTADQTRRNQIEARTAALFSAFEDGDFDAAEALLAPDCAVTQNGNSADWPAMRPLLEGLRPIMGPHRYTNVRRVVTADVVVEEHHVESTTPAGHELKLFAAVVIRFDEAGLIVSVDEYVDPTPLTAALSSD